MAPPHPAPRFDRQDYFAWEPEQPVKHEYVAGEVFAQAGARQNHVVVAGNCFAALRQRLRERLMHSPNLSTARVADSVALAFRLMWRGSCAGQAPAPIILPRFDE